MFRIAVNEKECVFDTPQTVGDILNRMLPDGRFLGCFCGGSILELNAVLDSDVTIRPITFQDEEGRRIYERSLRFILLLAAGRCFPDRQIRIEHSVGYGVYMRFIDCPVTDEELSLLSYEMRKIISQDLPFVKERWTRRQAMDYFAQAGQHDIEQLLMWRPYDYFDVYHCAEMAEYFYGAMLPSTGYVKVFALWKCREGFVMQMPSPKAPDVPAPAVDRPNHMKAFELSRQWCRVLGCNNVADLNNMIRRGEYRDFIRVNEALQDKAIGAIADEVQGKGARAVFIAGPSSSGKTTFANRLCIHLKVLGLTPRLISLDDFYIDRDKLPLEADGRPDLEALSALDVPLIRECLGKLLDGQEAMMPRFDFEKQKRAQELVPMRLGQGDVLVMEGIHGLNPALHEGFSPELIYKIFITELTCLNLDNHNRIRTTDARLLRRIVRDYHFRGTSPVETLRMWPSVRAGEEKWIFPYQEQADYVFNSALHYELPLLKTVVYDLLDAIKPDDKDFSFARRLLKILHYMLPAPEDSFRELPPLSLLREFVGGCTFYD